MKILTVIGARPQFIKAAPLSKAIKDSEGIEEVTIHTGQHYDKNMSDIFFKDMSIPQPKYLLNVGSGMHGKQTGQMLMEIEEILVSEKPSFVLVFGDTNSTLAGALAAAKLNIPVVHVEAGLRSRDMKMPEEKNRILTDHISSLLFSPTKESTKNLLEENISRNKIFEVGDIMYDSFKLFRNKIATSTFDFEKLRMRKEDYVLATIHRAENTDNPIKLRSIVKGMVKISTQVDVCLPIHPRTRKMLEQENLLDELSENIILIEPVGFIDMLNLIINSKLIMTDSGGLQKEAYFAQKLCITLRDSTEWVELVDEGFNTLVDATSHESIFEAFENAIKNQKELVWTEGLYGEGNSAKLIVENIKKYNEDSLFN